MYFAIDLILVALMAAVIFNAVRRGFIVSVFRLLAAVVSVAAAAIFYKDLGLVFYDHFVYDKISGYLSGLIARAAENSDGTFDLHAFFSELPENIRNITDVFGVNIDALFAEFLGAEHATEGDVLDLSGRMAENIARTVSNILAFAAIFFAALIVLNLLCLILDSFAKLPVLHGTNKLLGLLFGAAEALLIGVIISYVIAALCKTYGTIDETFAYRDVIDRTCIAKFLYGFSPYKY